MVALREQQHVNEDLVIMIAPTTYASWMENSKLIHILKNGRLIILTARESFLRADIAQTDAFSLSPQPRFRDTRTTIRLLENFLFHRCLTVDPQFSRILIEVTRCPSAYAHGR